MKLTGKQEAFAQAYVELGGNASEAYRRSYDTRKMKPETIHVKASELLKHGKVSVRIAHLQRKAEEIAMKEFEITIQEKMKLLWKIANSCATQTQDESGTAKMINPSAAISAITELNKMAGHYASAKMTPTGVEDILDELL